MERDLFLLWGALFGVVAMHVYDAAHDWWRSRSDQVVDGSYKDVCDALRGVCDGVELPAFRVVSRLYDWAEDGAA